MLKRVSMAAVLVILCGCFKVKDEITLNADGSGTVRIETRTALPQQMLGEFGTEGPGNMGLVYPPIMPAQTSKLFPAKDFDVTSKSDRTTNGETVVTVEASFKNINALLASPYGRAHQLSLKVDRDTLVLQALSGVEGLALMTDIKDDGEMGFGMMASLGDLEKQKTEMRSEFRVTLPNAVASANGTRDGKTVTWLAERAKFKDNAAFAAQLGVVCEARCPADGFKAAPVTPQRIALAPFKQLADVGGDKGTALDTNAIQNAAKFVPYGLQVTRTLDLGGEGGGERSGAQLIGAIVLPKEFAPQKWGGIKLDEAVDAKGNNLKLGDSSEERMSSSMNYHYSSSGDDESEAGDTSKGAATEERHTVSLNFRPPEWKVNEIARIKGSVELRYFSGSQLVKLTNAIQAGWIQDESRARRTAFSGESGRKLDDPALAGLGLTLNLEMAAKQSAMTMLMLEVGGKNATLLDVQVFDAEGRPWPTLVQNGNDSEFGEDREGAGSCMVVVIGKPTPPLSLALLASGNGATVSVPISIEHVPVMPGSK